MWITVIAVVLGLITFRQYITRLFGYETDYKIYINREANVIPKREEANQTSIDDAQTSFEKNLSHYDPPPSYEEVFNCDDLKFICDQKSFAHLNPAQDIEPSAPNLELISPQQNNNHDTDINPSRRGNSNRRGERRIKFSWQIYGSFKVKLICFNGIMNRCWRAENAGGCPYLHASVPYQWQFGRGKKWYNFHPKHSEELERNYRDPECEFTHLQKLDNHLDFKNLQGILSLLGAERTKVDFIQNTIENEDTKETYSIRHITTASSVINDNIFSTEFVWYFKNDTKWEKLGSRKCPTEMIELAYEEDFYTSFLYRSCKSSFHLDFEDMTRRSLATGNETEIRRRPAPFKDSSFIFNRKHNRMEKRRWANWGENYNFYWKRW